MRASSSSVSGARPIVIIGASVAGLSVAEGLRRQGHVGQIVLVDAADAQPGDRPPLSKAALMTEKPSAYEIMPSARRDALDLTYRLGVTAESLLPCERSIHLGSGEQLAFSDLVIACGVRPRRIRSLDDALASQVHTLRTSGDAARLREALSRKGRLAVVGGGVLGLEVAATASSIGCDVTVIEAASNALAAKLGRTISDRLVALHGANGVRLRFGTSVVDAESSVEDGRPIARLRLTDGSIFDADDVLVSIGCIPNTDWLAGSGLDSSDGVVCDGFGMASPGIWAAGDVASIPRAGQFGPQRVEHKQNAIDQGRLIASNILASRQDAPQSRLAATPYFWTDQFDVKVQSAGWYSEAAEEIVRPVEGARDGAFAVRYMLKGRLLGAATWNAPKAMTQLRAEIEREHSDVALLEEVLS